MIVFFLLLFSNDYLNYFIEYESIIMWVFEEHLTKSVVGSIFFIFQSQAFFIWPL